MDQNFGGVGEFCIFLYYLFVESVNDILLCLIFHVFLQSQNKF